MESTIRPSFTVDTPINPALRPDQAVPWVNLLTDMLKAEHPALYDHLVGFLLMLALDRLYVTFDDERSALFFREFIDRDEALRKRIGRLFHA